MKSDESMNHCRVRLLGIPWTVVLQALLSMEFSRQEYWSELPFHSPGDLPRLRIKPVSPAWKVDSLPVSHLGSLHFAVGLR